MTERSLENLNRLGIVGYTGLVLAVAIGLAQITPAGGRQAVTFALVVLTGVSVAFAYLSRARHRALVLWAIGAVLATGGLLTTFAPTSAGSRQVPDVHGSATATSDASTSTTPPESGPDVSSPSPMADTTSPESIPSVKPMPRTVDVTIGTAAVLYDGDLRVSVSSAYDGYAVMGIFTFDQTCADLFPDVGRTMAMVVSDRLAYDVTLLASTPDIGVHIEVRRRAPTDDEVLPTCPNTFG